MTVKSGESVGTVEITPSCIRRGNHMKRLCECHDKPMYHDKGRKMWLCSVDRAEWNKRWYQEHPQAPMEAYRRRQKRHAERRRGIVFAERASRGDACEDCGARGRLLWHHATPSTKLFSIAKATQVPDDALIAELTKCVLVCGKCHARHHREMSWL